MTITEASIRERLAADREKVSRLPTWEEIEYLLDVIDLQKQEYLAGLDALRVSFQEQLRQVRKEHAEEMRDAGRELREMQAEISNLRSAAGDHW